MATQLFVQAVQVDQILYTYIYDIFDSPAYQ